jgi:hypothetical protein
MRSMARMPATDSMEYAMAIAAAFGGYYSSDAPPNLPINMIVLNEGHLRRLMSEYVRYYHEDRTHLGLEKETPAGR